MHDHLPNRRRFLVAAIALSGFTAEIFRPSLLGLSKAWAESPGKGDPETMAAMVRMARLLYPHDALSDGFYAEVLDEALSAVASGPAFAGHLDAAAAALDAGRSKRWSELVEAEQIAAMLELEDKDFFAAIRDAVRAGIYLNPVFWQHVGYPGSSKEHGGYLHRGSGDIDWLPEES